MPVKNSRNDDGQPFSGFDFFTEMVKFRDGFQSPNYNALMPSFSYAQELVGKAAVELVKEGTLRDRLLLAARQFVLAPSDYLPDDLKRHHVSLVEKLCVDGKINISGMTDSEAENVAIEILTLNSQIRACNSQHK
jgi:hypothetical protein